MFELCLFEQVTAQSALTYFTPVGCDFCQVKMSSVIMASGNWLAQVLWVGFDGASKLVTAVFAGVQGILKLVIDGTVKLLVVIIDGIKTTLPATAEFLKQVASLLTQSQMEALLKHVL